jgi:hypothetical protein
LPTGFEFVTVNNPQGHGPFVARAYTALGEAAGFGGLSSVAVSAGGPGG